MKRRKYCGRNPGSGGFTLVEVAATIAVLVAFAVCLAPAMARQRSAPKTLQCLQNLRTLMTSLTMYAQDNSGLLPPNPDDGNTIAGHNWCAGMAGAGMANQYDPDLLKDKARNLLGPYLKWNTGFFSCAADPRPSGAATGVSSSNPEYKGRLLRPARSVSMSGAVGTICTVFSSGGGHSGKPNLPVNGPWLDNNHNHRAGLPYATFPRLTQSVLSPGKLWMLLEEAPNSINDANFGFGMKVEEWLDFPGVNHDYGAVLGFADGHGELHRWTDARTGSTTSFRVPVPGSRDWAWMAERTTAKVQAGAL